MKAFSYVMVISLASSIGCGDDAVDPGGNPDEVIVQLTDLNGDPAAGISVVFQDSNGAMVDSFTTDPDGEAASTQAGGGMLTIAWERDTNERRLFTLGHVENGQVIQYAIEIDDEGSELGSATISFPSTFAGAERYAARVPCNNNENDDATDLMVTIYDDCLNSDGMLPVMIAAIDEDSDPEEVLAYAFAELAPPVGGGSVSVNPTIWQDSFTDWTIDFTNLAGFDAVGTDNVSVLSGGRYLRFGGDSFSNISGGTASISQAVPTGAERVQSMFFAVPDLASFDLASIYYIDTDSTQAITLDATSDMLPAPTSFNIAEGATTTVSWEWDGNASDLDGIFFESDWFDSATSTSYEWNVIIPPLADGSFTYPELPASLSNWEPGTGIEMFFLMSDFNFVDDFDDLRRALANSNLEDGPPLDPDGGDTILRAAIVNQD